jgi:DNA-binding FrmR family transcriptional regulator
MAVQVKKAMRVGYLADEDKRALKNRLSRAVGQIEAIARMIDEGACADEILIQIAAAKSALTGTALALVEEHLINCATRCMQDSADEVVRRVTRALAAVLKGA